MECNSKIKTWNILVALTQNNKDGTNNKIWTCKICNFLMLSLNHEDKTMVVKRQHK